MTSKQYQLLSFIRNNVVHLGKSPTYREMKLFMKVNSNQAIDDLLTGLEKQKYIFRKGKIRGIVLAKKGLGYTTKFTFQVDSKFESPAERAEVINYSSAAKDNHLPPHQITGVGVVASVSGDFLLKGVENDGGTTS